MFPRDAAGVLAFAATPTFALMALLTGFPGGSQPEIFCSAAHAMAPFGGMVPMYLLMSVFHAAPWLKLMGAGSIRFRTRVCVPMDNREHR
jgi:hypothetical protein